MVRLRIGWLKGAITRQSQVRTRHIYDYRVFVDCVGSTHSVRRPLSMYSVDGSSGERCWALLECLAQASGSDRESKEGEGKGYDEEDEEEDEEED